MRGNVHLLGVCVVCVAEAFGFVTGPGLIIIDDYQNIAALHVIAHSRSRTIIMFLRNSCARDLGLIKSTSQ